VLLVSAGLSLAEMLPAGSGWLPWLMIVPAYLAGHRMASLSLALGAFAVVAFTGLALAFLRSSDPLSQWVSLAMVEFVAAVLPWWFGRHRRLQAEQREREHGIVAEQARLRERARIAQDMHDALGHELALIALHGGALELAAGLPDDQRRAVGELRAGAVRATHRLHEIVRVFGKADAATGLQPADESIEGLVRRAAAAGLRVRLRYDGAGPTGSPMTSQAAHRVVQESLTNAARHAAGAAVTVTVARRQSGTRIDVVNGAPVRPGTSNGTGQGLIGLDERVRLVGGRLDAGPRPDGGWAVTAELPDGSGPRRDDGPPGFELGVSKRTTRRRLLETAALPLGLGLALLAGIAGVHLSAVARTGLSDDRYGGLRIGVPRAQVEPLLPAQSVGDAPAVLREPPPPPGATCVYYQAGTNLAVLDPDYYRICFAGGVLVAKDRLKRA
jgi:signal transduction histidine kinase